MHSYSNSLRASAGSALKTSLRVGKRPASEQLSAAARPFSLSRATAAAKAAALAAVEIPSPPTGEAERLATGGTILTDDNTPLGVGASARGNDCAPTVEDGAVADNWSCPRPEVSMEEETIAPPIFYRGRLRQHQSFWRGLRVPLSLLVLSWIVSGVSVQWADPFERPESWMLPNHGSLTDTPEHLAFTRGAISDLVVRGAARKVSYAPHGVSPLGIAQHARTKKLRLIFDLRWLNSFLLPYKFKYEGLNTIREVARPGDCAFSLDLSAAYHHCDMLPSLRRYLGFEFEGQFYEFCSLPFGLAPACRTFTYIVRGLAAHWRSQGIRLVHYIDDWVFFCRPDEHAARVAQILADVKASGFVVNLEKSAGLHEPTFTFDWIGHTIDLTANTISVMAVHQTHIIKMCSDLIALGVSAHVTAVTLMRVAGKISSCWQVVKRPGRMFTFNMHRLAHSVARKEHFVALSAAALRECTFWRDNFARLNVCAIWSAVVITAVDVRLRADAGEPGWGSFIETLDGQPPPEPLEANGRWRSSERHRSSTWRELIGLRNTIMAFGRKLMNRSVLAYVDAKNVYFAWAKGGSKHPDHHEILVELQRYCDEHNIQLETQWIPREENERADYLSKLIDCNDWQLAKRHFRRLTRKWGRCTVDLFASHRNNMVERYFSVFYTPSSAGVDAFTRNWGPFALCWCHPPFDLVGEALRHAHACGARMILIVPEWRGHSWWPTLRSGDGKSWAPFVSDWEALPSDDPRLFVPGVGGDDGAAARSTDPNRFQCYALLVDFSTGIQLF